MEESSGRPGAEISDRGGRHNCEDAWGQTSVFNIFFTKKRASEIAKMWGRLRPNARCFFLLLFILHFFDKKRKRYRENVRTSQAKRPFLKNLTSFVFIFSQNMTQPVREIVRTSQANRLFLFFLLLFDKKIRATENAKLWGRLTPNARFWKKTNKILSFFSKIERENVRTSQAKRPFLKCNDR